MKLNHKLLILKNYFFDQYNNKCYSLRILNYHNIPVSDLKNFENQIIFFKDNYDILSPIEFENLKSNDFSSKKILITFDDGFKSIVRILPILQKYKIQAIFFVIKDFIMINQKDVDYFIKNNIFRNNSYSIDDSNLNIEDIKNIISLGHTIGYHTKSHIDLGKIYNTNIIRDEIIESARNFEKMIDNVQIKHFAFPYGMSKNLTNQSIKIMREKYKFIYSGIRGNNYQLINNQLPIYKRDEISPHYNLNLVTSILNGSADFYYNQIYKSILL